MKLGKWPHLYALLLGRGISDWKWRLVETAPGDTPMRALVQDDSAGGENLCGIFAVGETLSLQARVIEQVSPTVLKEVSERAVLVQDAKERLEPLMQLAQRLTQRAYQHKRSDEYADLHQLRATLSVLLKLLDATEAPGLDELVDWEVEAKREVQRAQPPQEPL